MNDKLRRLYRSFTKSQLHYVVDPLAEKADLVERIREKAEGGLVVIASSGMDCDGVRYSGSLSRPLPAVPMLVIREIDRNYEWADGPISCSVISPSEAKAVRYESRDLGMEAFENGHPHVIYG